MQYFLAILLILAAVSSAKDQDNTIEYTTPAHQGLDNGVYLHETFDNSNNLPKNFVLTTGTKQDEDGDKYSGEWGVEAVKKNGLNNDLGLVIKTKAKHHGIAVPLNQPFVFANKDELVIQYEVNFQNGIECGGAYIKLFSQDDTLSLENFHDKTRFTIMFGPDKCANDYKLHFIFNHQSPKTELFDEKHLKVAVDSAKLKNIYNDAKTHLYKLVLKSDNTFIISVDNEKLSSGNLLDNMNPAINPDKEVVDANDEKPQDWDDNELIADPTDSKPETWDENAPKKITDSKSKMPDNWREDLESQIEDPEAIMPDDWDEEMDGEYMAPLIDNPECEKISGCGLWEPPMIDNPSFKGKWYPKQIKNTNYQGEWKAKMIENPDFFEDLTPFSGASSIAAMALELWTMSDDIYFDNFFISDNNKAAEEFQKQTFNLKVDQVKANQPTILEKAKEVTKDKPWLWAVIAIVASIIVVLFIWLRKPAKKAPSAPEKKDDDYKKPEEEPLAESMDENEVEESENEVEESENEVEESENEEEGQGDDDNQESQNDDEAESSNAEEAGDGDNSNESEDEPTPAAASNLRKRRTRAD